MRRLIALAAFTLAAGCAVISGAEQEEGEAIEHVSDGQIIGTNDFVVVTNDGANIPAKYRPLIDAFGVMSVGCTATHVGNGIVVTAGHCFSLGARVNNKSCTGTVSWGYRKDKAAYLKSNCQTILAGEVSGGRDWAIFKVSPVPPVKVDVELGGRRPNGTPLTIFGHPQTRPLEWSKTCSMITGSGPTFYHTCDTEPGNSGSSILDDNTLRVVGIHDGATGNRNYATHIADTPIKDYVTPSDGGGGGGGGNDGGGGGGTCTNNESEPNNQYTSPDPLAGKLCGKLDPAGDQDWFSWSVSSAGVAYDLNLVATGDAQLQMWKLVSGQYYKIENTTPTRFTKTASGAGTYVVVVHSPGGAAQSYNLTLTK